MNAVVPTAARRKCFYYTAVSRLFLQRETMFLLLPLQSELPMGRRAHHKRHPVLPAEDIIALELLSVLIGTIGDTYSLTKQNQAGKIVRDMG